MKIRICFVCFFIIGVAGLLGCRPKESEDERYDREAKQIMLGYCTNNIVGLSRLISVNLTHFDSNGELITSGSLPLEGQIVAEFVNHIGGIDRTNLTFRFSLNTNEARIPTVCVSLDYHWFAEQNAIKTQAEYDAWLKKMHD